MNNHTLFTVGAHLLMIALLFAGCKGLKSTERKLIEIKNPDPMQSAKHFKEENVVGNVIYTEIATGHPRGKLVVATFAPAKGVGPLFGGEGDLKKLYGADVVEVLKLNKFDHDSEPIGIVEAEFSLDPAEPQVYKNFRKDDLKQMDLPRVGDCAVDDKDCERWRLFVVKKPNGELVRCPFAFPGPVTNFKESENGEKLTITQGEEFKLTWTKTNEDGGELRYVRIVPVEGKGFFITREWPETDESTGSRPFGKEMTQKLPEGDYTLSYETRQTSNCEIADGDAKTIINFESRSIRQVPAAVAKPKEK
jgi:hypothetical protein